MSEQVAALPLRKTKEGHHFRPAAAACAIVMAIAPEGLCQDTPAAPGANSGTAGMDSKFQKFMSTAVADGEAPEPAEGADRELADPEVLEMAAAEAGKRFKKEPLKEAAFRATLYRCYHDLGMDSKALPHAQRSLALRQRELGEDSGLTLDSRTFTANCLTSLEKFAEAEAGYRAVIKARTRLSGAESLDTLMCRENLAILLEYRKQYAEAEKEHRDVVAILQRVTDPRSWPALYARMNLANLIRLRGRRADAEPQLRYVVKIVTEISGPEHRRTLLARHNLACVLLTEADPGPAVSEFETILPLREKLIGREHPHTLSTRENLVRGLMMAGRTMDAEKLAIDLVSQRKRVNGEEHHTTLWARYILSVIEQARGQFAREEMESLLQTQTRVLGPGHRETLAVRHNIARAAQARGEDVTEEMRTIRNTALKSLGPKDVETLRYNMALAAALGRRGDHAEAQKQYSDAWPKLMEVTGGNSADTLQAAMGLAYAFANMGNRDDALKIAAQGAIRARQHLPESHPVRQGLERLLKTLEQQEAQHSSDAAPAEKKQ